MARGKPREKRKDVPAAQDNDAQEKAATPGSQGGGITGDKLKRFSSQYEKLKSDSDETRGELGALLKDFEEQGGHKAALKFAIKLKNMESSKAQDTWRSLENYMHELGVFAQHDLFDSFDARGGNDGEEEQKQAPLIPDEPRRASGSTH